MACCCCCVTFSPSSSASSSPPRVASRFGNGARDLQRRSLSWACCFQGLQISTNSIFVPLPIQPRRVPVIRAAWTRRSQGELAKRPNRKSWKQRTDMYMRPFLLNVFFSKRFIHAKVMHRNTCKVISAASTNARDLRFTLPSLTDQNACRIVGRLIAERSKEADVFAMAYDASKDERIEGKLGIILDTIKENEGVENKTQLLDLVWDWGKHFSPK